MNTHHQSNWTVFFGRVFQGGRVWAVSLFFLFCVGCGEKKQVPRPTEQTQKQKSAQTSRVITPSSKAQIVRLVGQHLGKPVTDIDEKKMPQIDNFSDFRQQFGPVFRMLEKEGKLDDFLRDLKATCSAEEYAYVELWMMRQKKDERYVSEAKKFLKTHQDDALAADVMRIYADRKDEKAFQSFGEEYAKGQSQRLLEYSEIARNVKWEPMKVAFAKQALAQKDLPFMPTYRCASFLMEAKEYDAAGETLERLEKQAQKRYQQEDVLLMRFQLAEQAGNFKKEDLPALERLSKKGMMPPVRREAKKLLQRLSK